MEEYENMSKKELKKIYTEKRDQVNSLLEERGDNGRLSKHVPCSRDSLLDMIIMIDFILDVDRTSKEIDGIHKEIQKNLNPYQSSIL